MFLSAESVHGNVVNLLRNHEKHIDPKAPAGQSAGPEKAFGDVLLNAFNVINNQQHSAQELAQQMITDPDSVNVHDVTIAVAEANMALSLTKSIVDGALRAYKEIIQTR
jgi:flagellar hook-basal body complex protein FliE